MTHVKIRNYRRQGCRRDSSARLQMGVVYECQNKFTSGVYAVGIIDRTEDTSKPTNRWSLLEAVLHEAAPFSVC